MENSSKGILVYNDLWCYVDGTEEYREGNLKEWLQEDTEALVIIKISISPRQLTYIKRAETWKEMWNALKRSNLLEGMYSLQKTAKIKKGSKRNNNRTHNPFTDISYRFAEAGLVIKQELLCTNLFISLSDEYENLCALESRNTMPTLKSSKN